MNKEEIVKEVKDVLNKEIDKTGLLRVVFRIFEETTAKLNFIKDWGKYNDRVKYGLSEVEYKNQMEEFSKEITIRIISQVICEVMLTHLSLDDLYRDILKEIINNLKEKK